MKPFDIVKGFEEAVAEYTGAKHAIAVESCSSALLLCCVHHAVDIVTLPAHTYFSAANAVIHAGGKIHFHEYTWKGQYRFLPYPIIDSARRFYKNMYRKGFDICLSFHGKKILNLGRGGMILTDNNHRAEWYRAARFDGRNEGVPTKDDQLKMVGYHMYMTPEVAAHGLSRMAFIPNQNRDVTDTDPDLRQQTAYLPYTVDHNPRFKP